MHIYFLSYSISPMALRPTFSQFERLILALESRDMSQKLRQTKCLL
jgi:hypothetical protein